MDAQTAVATPVEVVGVGGRRPGRPGPPLSDDARGLVEGLRGKYQSSGKKHAADSYVRHAMRFLSWCEQSGLSVRSLPADAAERYLEALAQAGASEVAVHITRTQLRTVTGVLHAEFGLDCAHLEYLRGKPRSVRDAQNAKQKAKRQAARTARDTAVDAAMSAVYPKPVPAGDPRMPDAVPAPEVAPPVPVPAAPARPAGAAPDPRVVVVQMPAQQTAPARTPAGTAASTQTGASLPRGVRVGNHEFTGAYLRVSRVADGTDPLAAPGTEVMLQTVPMAQVAPYGDFAGWLQQRVMPYLRLGPLTSQVQFVVHELDDRRRPTGRRDELVVGVPLGREAAGPQAYGYGYGAQPEPEWDRTSPYARPQPPREPWSPATGAAPPGDGSATGYLIQKLDREAEAARQRAEDLQGKMAHAADAQTMSMLMQAFQREQDLRRDLDAQVARVREEAAFRAAQPVAQPALAGLPEPHRPDPGVETMKAFAESNARIVEVIAGRPHPVAPPPADGGMNVLLVELMKQNAAAEARHTDLMVKLVTRENPLEKAILAKFLEDSGRPKDGDDDLDRFATKVERVQRLSGMLGNGQQSVVSEILANIDAVPKIIAAARAKPENMRYGDGDGEGDGDGDGAQRQLPAKGKALAKDGEDEAVPAEAAKAAREACELAAKGEDNPAVQRTLDALRAMETAGGKWAHASSRLVAAFRQADDEAEMYAFAKSLRAFCGLPADRDASRALADVLARWYPEICRQALGVERPPIVDPDEEEDGEASKPAAGPVAPATAPPPAAGVPTPVADPVVVRPQPTAAA